MAHAKLSSPIYALIEAAVIDLFVGGAVANQRALVQWIARRAAHDPNSLSSHLPDYFRRLAKRGIYVPQLTSGPRKSGIQTRPHAFNWSPNSLQAPALEIAALHYLEDPKVAPAKKSAVRSALRVVLDLPTKCSDGRILTAARGVASDELLDLPGRTYECSIGRPLEKQTAKNHRSAIRSLLRYAAQNRLIPLVFPRGQQESPWTRVRDQYFPLPSVGRATRLITSMRTAFNTLGKAAMNMFGANVQFGDMTRGKADQLIDHLLFNERRTPEGYSVRSALRYLAANHDVGPYTDPSKLDMFEESTPHGPKPKLYIRGPNGEGVTGDWDGLIELLRDLGFPKSLRDFLEWYGQYVTLPPLVVLHDPRYPVRWARHHVSEVTLKERVQAVKAILGIVTQTLPVSDEDTAGLGLRPASITPDVVFGKRFEEAIAEMIKWWQARSVQLPKAALGKTTGGALRQLVIGSGMIALARYEWLRHKRKQKSSTKKLRKGEDVLDIMAEESVPKTPRENDAWEAYRHACVVSDALADLGTTKTGRARKRTNEFRDIRRILENTPPAYWIGLLERMIELFRKLKSKGADDLYYHTLVLDTALLGLLISTGCRIQELSLVRLDVQFDRHTRVITLRAIDRKNNKPHDVLLQDAYLPDDLLDEYLERTRPWFIAGKPTLRRSSKKKLHLSKVPPHPFLLVSTAGTPFACLNENADGTNRDVHEMGRRAQNHGQRFQRQMAKMAKAFKLSIPSSKYEFGPHSVRGACGYGVRLVLGLQAAAHYLGDEEDTVRGYYSAVNGRHVDSSCLVGFRVGSAAPTQPLAAPPAAPAEGYHARMRALREDYKAGLMSEAQYKREQADINEEFGVAA